MHNRHSPIDSGSAFTLIELLVVIAIIAIFSVVVILTLNPAEILRQSRDSSRLSDMATMNSAFGIYAEDTGGSMGTPSTTYISIPDPTATTTLGDQCQGLGLPAQSTSSGWTYACGASSSYRNVDSTGWIPANFTQISSGAPFGSLPQDPINQTSTNLFYTYTTDGKTFEVTAVMESQKYRGQIATNPPLTLYPGIDAVGTNLTLSGLWNPNGLLAYWNFEEGSGSSTIDQSSNGNTGTWYGPPDGDNGTYYTGGKVGSYAGYFNKTDFTTDYLAASSSASLGNIATATVSLWTKQHVAITRYLIDARASGGTGYIYWQPSALHISKGTVYVDSVATTSLPGNDGNWHFIVVSGISLNITSQVNMFSNNLPGAYWKGLGDDYRIYNRALSAAEIQAIYNAQK
jgi:prepilin-type N-terminal cleavage/methylation domain-containing protein